jgi:hypothetical protein
MIIVNVPLSKDNYIEATSPGRDFLDGRAGDDVLVSNGGYDWLDGGPGHDVLIGVSYHHQIIGYEPCENEQPSDSFAFKDEYCGCCEPVPIYSTPDGVQNHWRMCDVRESQGGYGGDVVVGWGYDASVNLIGRDGRRAAIEADNFVNGTKALDAEDRIIYDETTGRCWIDPDGVGGKKKMLVATFIDDADNNPYVSDWIHPRLFAGDFEIPKYMLDL